MRHFLPFEFHISRSARQLYGLQDLSYTTDGRIIIADINTAREFAQKINSVRDVSNNPDKAVRAGEINALGLLDEINHRIMFMYRQLKNPNASERIEKWLDEQLSPIALDSALRWFLNEFPPARVYKGLETVDQYLAGKTTDSIGKEIPNRQIAIEELTVLWITNSNPAAVPYSELFSDENLRKTTIYPQIIDEILSFYKMQPPAGTHDESLLDLLRLPIQVAPGSLSGQLDFIRANWGEWISDYELLLLTGVDIIHEETRPYFPPGPGPVIIPDFKGDDYRSISSAGGNVEPEVEKFSPDLEWMPNLVMIAKNSFVWLDQLSKKYQRNITHLDDVPQEELQLLAEEGITGLWLIGIWERSRASRTIKQLRGNPDAVASAYSLYSYEIAEDLGGEEAFQKLRQRAAKVGIRLASDMVPNHMGIDSTWVIQHPDWFVSLDICPFPSYTFTGINLSGDERVGIFLEDHYYDNTDAAVVFKRQDFWTGSVKYIYHGNDGTSMPWNDTAQLNYLIPQVREAVIQTILHVARKFPIIRFDAAMTLAKRHYHRLWFPEPGSGGDIPSRAGLGLSKARFDEVFPQEFWREVVDRVAQEVPDTLLLAEAFWMMEGYFVRTLGMHRVYNSAFMNMLRDEKNQEYRLVIKNTLEFDAEILKRYVNFMNNPDERTAVDQFGKGDKYFGICTLMATLPGLPMLGHGQIEGFSEKYGMEYRRAYWDEYPDPYLVERHQHQIFPLLRKRALFAEVHNFRLYDFYKEDGTVDEDVFVYSNQRANDKVLVVYHNRFKLTSGWINVSTPFPSIKEDGKVLIQQNLADSLGLPNSPLDYVILKDTITGLEFLYNCAEIHQHGMHLVLNAYQSRVFSNISIIRDSSDRKLDILARKLNGTGVGDVMEAVEELALEPLLTPMKELINSGFINWLIQNRVNERGVPPRESSKAIAEFRVKFQQMLRAVQQWLIEEEGLSIERMSLDPIVDQSVQELSTILALPALRERFSLSKSKTIISAIDYFGKGPQDLSAISRGNSAVWTSLFALLLLKYMTKIVSEVPSTTLANEWFSKWHLDRQVVRALTDAGVDRWSALRCVQNIQMLLRWQGWCDQSLNKKEILDKVLTNLKSIPENLIYINVNQFNNFLWFNKEMFEEFTWWLLVLHVCELLVENESFILSDASQSLIKAFSVIEELLTAESRSEYKLDNLSI